MTNSRIFPRTKLPARRLARPLAALLATTAVLFGLAAPVQASPSPDQDTSATESGTGVEAATPAPEPVDLRALPAERGPYGARLGQGVKSHQAPTLQRMQLNVQSAEPAAATWMPPGVQGLDVSGWQGDVNWTAQANQGARFAYVKATEGTGFKSSSFASQYNGSRNAGLIRGAYHFALPNDGSTAAGQADYFVNNGGGWSADGWTLPPLLDIEYNPYDSLGNTCYNMSPSQIVNWVKAFSNQVKARTGRLPMVYTTTDWWKRCTGNSPALGGQPLHIAAYSTWVGEMPFGWSTYSVWQYSSTGPFAGDSNVWRGSYAQLQKFAANATGSAPEPAVASTADVVAADSSGNLWRYTAGFTGTLGAPKKIGTGWLGLRSINVIDWNADGILDLVAQWTSGKLNVYLGNAFGGFATGPVLAASGWAGYQLTIGYWLPGSYYPQVLSRDDAGTVRFSPNDSGGLLGTSSIIGQGWANVNMTMIDFDGDGNPDILGQDSDGTMRLFRSGGDGRFIYENRPVVGNGWNAMTSVTVASGFNGYGSVGLITRDKSGVLSYFPVPGGSNWGTKTGVGNGWNGFLIAGGETINGGPATAPPSLTSASDVVVVNTAGQLVRYRPSGGVMGSGTVIGSGFSGVRSVHSADWNADGAWDVLVQQTSGALVLYKGLPSGGFAAVTLASSGFAGVDLVAGKWLNQSRFPSILAIRADGTLNHYANTSGTGLSTPAVIGQGFARQHLSLGDFDGDGNPDVAASDYLGTMKLFRSNGDGGWITESRRVLGTGWNAKTSISAVTGFSGTGSVGLLARNTAGQLDYFPSSSAGLGPATAAGSGFNGSLVEGSPLLLRSAPLGNGGSKATVDSSGALWSLPSTGTGGFDGPFQIGTGWSGVKSVHIVDWNSDGVRDVLTQWDNGSLTVHFGLSTGGFARSITLAASGWAGIRFISAPWITGAPYPGLLGTTASGDLYYWANASGAGLSPARKIGTGWGALRIAVVDYDADGKQDVLAVNSAGSMLLYRSNGQGGFMAESRRIVGSGWSGIPQFSTAAAFTDSGSRGLMAVLSGGGLKYYPLVGPGTWGTPVTLPASVGAQLASY